MLFQLGAFKLHSGQVSAWKIDCDHLTDGDIEALAVMATELLPAFGGVVSIPRGGDRLGYALRKYCSPDVDPMLIVDDVLTTGRSMNEAREEWNGRGVGVFGLVIFARSHPPSWIMPIFQMPPAARERDG